jgi:hypothetical protein
MLSALSENIQWKKKRKKKKGDDTRTSKQVKCEDDAGMLLVCHVDETRERQG